MSNPKILIVDDEKDIVRALAMRLRAEGYDVLSGGDAIIGTQLAMRELPDLIILDIGMPCGDGFMVAERLLANNTTMLIPIIFLTARTTRADMMKGLGMGGYAYLTKPFNSDELLSLVAQALAYREAISA